jgi:pimeloyl-ACP methyl ester carboxylesterase
MNHFLFGTSKRRLFGIYDAAVDSTGARRAAILCYPWAAEYTYAHRTMRQLALKLSSIGFHILRFDYYGTGDSGGDSTDIDLLGWQADLETAIEELTEITGLTKVTLIGMRLGAVVAAGVASRLRNVVEAVVLWDPIMSGPEYLKQLGIVTNDGPPFDVQGFSVTERWLRDLTKLDLVSLISRSQSRTLVIVTERSPSHGQLIPIVAGKRTISIEHLADVHPWLESSVDSGIVPSSVLRRIVNWLDDS